MKKNLFLRLCLTMTVVLSFLSCRQDLLPEQETYNNSSAFQLTSKRISLNESKHKLQLLPELEQVEHKFKTFAKSDAQGKIVNYANGVSIDTDNVIYIENGANFHTYTFNIKRANAPETAPLENLLLIRWKLQRIFGDLQPYVTGKRKDKKRRVREYGRKNDYYRTGKRKFQ